ncbi:hypothetical protein CHS0354_032040 [Potamilus streckersoni]|uniref:Cytochrome c oxidase assembly protein COX11, mitochondrial n=1 Tax=Potamilus streckersoni TaxID=2493646 RepID=A0AAE0TLH4_9BIVA|nr:hypothetical protein CHS0354_032040 [Potamilus streckersoni]
MIFPCQGVLRGPSLVWKVIKINRVLPQDVIKQHRAPHFCMHTRPINRLPNNCIHSSPCFIKDILFSHSIRNCVSVRTTIFNIRGFSTLSHNKPQFENHWVRFVGIRLLSGGKGTQDAISYKRRTVLTYILAGCIFMVGASYAGVPLYRMFCQATGLGGQAGLETKGHKTSKIETMQKVEDRVIKVMFNADVSASMRWNFKPQQHEIQVIPGETALAFYTATNPTDKPIVGISTYNILPFEAGQYFNKIQCFCFEEQRLNPHEQVDMPVFFYIDPDYAEDPKLENVNTIFLSYTFFEAKEGLNLPLPG